MAYTSSSHIAIISVEIGGDKEGGAGRDDEAIGEGGHWEASSPNSSASTMSWLLIDSFPAEP